MEISKTGGRRVIRLSLARGLRNAVGVFRAVGGHPALLLVKYSTRRVKSRRGHDRKNTVNDGMQCYSLVTLDGGGDYTCTARSADRKGKRTEARRLCRRARAGATTLAGLGVSGVGMRELLPPSLHGCLRAMAGSDPRAPFGHS